MKVTIYGIGGQFNDKVVGVAYDKSTADSLITLVELTGGHGVSLHGNRGEVVLSGGGTFKEARDSLFIFRGPMMREIFQ